LAEPSVVTVSKLRAAVRFCVACGLVLLAAARDARGAPRGLELVWSAPEGCPSEAEVLSAIEGLIGGTDAVLERPLRAEARVERNGAAFRLALDWSTATASAVRTVGGATCIELAQAAAVIIALASDPATNLEELANARGDEPPAPPLVTAPSLTPPPADAPSSRSREPAFARPDDRAGRDTRPGVRTGAALDLGSLPRASPGVFVGGDLPVASITLVLDALTFVPMDEVVPDGAGSFWLSTLSLRPCFRVPVSAVVLAPCGALELHMMLGEGDRVEIPDERWAFYARLGAGLEARYPIGFGLELAAGGHALVAPSRPTFVIGSGTPVHEPATVTGRLTLGFELKL
jgi:hypothetical protein